MIFFCLVVAAIVKLLKLQHTNKLAAKNQPPKAALCVCWLVLLLHGIMANALPSNKTVVRNNIRRRGISATSYCRLLLLHANITVTIMNAQ